MQLIHKMYPQNGTCPNKSTIVWITAEMVLLLCLENTPLKSFWCHVARRKASWKNIVFHFTTYFGKKNLKWEIFCVGHSQCFLFKHTYRVFFSIEKFFRISLYKRLFLLKNKLFLIFSQCFLVWLGWFDVKLIKYGEKSAWNRMTIRTIIQSWPRAKNVIDQIVSNDLIEVEWWSERYPQLEALFYRCLYSIIIVNMRFTSQWI